MASPVEWLLNSAPEEEGESVVQAPAFSITKVYSVLALVLTPLGALLAKSIDDQEFAAVHTVVLICAVLGFGAFAIVADLVARALVTSAQLRVDSSTLQHRTAQLRLAGVLGDVVPLEVPLPVYLITAEGPRLAGTVVAVKLVDNAMQYYVKAAGLGPVWRGPDDLEFG